MATNNFSVGSDTKVTWLSNGLPVSATILTEFEAHQMTAALDSTAIDGVNRFRDLEKGWEGTLAFDRGDSFLDDFFAAKEAARYAGNQPPVLTISETTTNPDGTVVKYRYDGVSVKYDTIGSRKGDAKVESKVSWRASRRIKVQ